MEPEVIMVWFRSFSFSSVGDFQVNPAVKIFRGISDSIFLVVVVSGLPQKNLEVFSSLLEFALELPLHQVRVVIFVNMKKTDPRK